MDNIINPKRRIVEDLIIRNKDNMNIIAGEYFGSAFTYKKTFEMIFDYKKAFNNLLGESNKTPITISAPSTIASVNAFYGAVDSNRIANLTGPGFLFAYTQKYTSDIGSNTVVVFDSFLNENNIRALQRGGIKNVIVTSISDYMNPIIKTFAKAKGVLPKKDFLDSYLSEGHALPKEIQFIKMMEFAKVGKKIKTDINYPYIENQIAAYFLTGATTSQLPKCVSLYADGFTKMAQIYEKLWFDFKPGDRQTVFIPIFYATGAIHGVHAGLFNGATLSYKPKYDRFAFAHDLKETKAKIALVAPSHMATLAESGLREKELNHVKYIFIGGEAIMPAQMKKFRESADFLGIEYILNGYGMTETGSMSGLSDKTYSDKEDVTITPIPGVKYRIVNPETREIVADGERGILEKYSPCATAGYVNSNADNKNLFTKDGWINTGDVAIKYPNGRYRVFGRGTDYFEVDGIKYAMFDIEESILEHEGVLEAEVVKYIVDDKECPVAFVVVKEEWKKKTTEILKYILKIKVVGIEHLLGVKFIDNFKTNNVTGKRDYLILQDEIHGFLNFDFENNKIQNCSIRDGKLEDMANDNN